MPKNNFRPLHRIADAVFCKPWMILPAFHQGTLAPQLIAAMDGKTTVHAYDDYDPPTAAEVEQSYNCRLIAAGKGDGDWEVTEKNRRASLPYNLSASSKVGQILVQGIIGKGLDSFDMSCGGVCVDHIQSALEHLGDLGARAVAIHFNTPGGTVTGVPEAAAAIRSFSESVAPVHAYTDTLCASAGYYLAAAADTITAAESADIGSIGVYSAIIDSSGYYEKAGIKVHLMASGWAKGQGMRGTVPSEDYLASVKADVMRHAERFWEHVSARRSAAIVQESAALTAASGAEVSPAAWASAIMQGQCWTAADAPRALIDGHLPNRAAHVRQLTAALTKKR